MLSRTRKLYQRLVQGRRPSESDIEKLIETSEQYKAMQKTAGWKKLNEWIERQQDGSHEAMEHEVANVNGFTLIALFNTFIKYLFRLVENRTYTKMDTYIAVTIKRGEDYAKQKVRANEQKQA